MTSPLLLAAFAMFLFQVLQWLEVPNPTAWPFMAWFGLSLLHFAALVAVGDLD